MKKLLLAVVLSVVGMGAAFAASPSWNYVEGNYTHRQEFSPQNGFNLQGSWNVVSNLYVVGSTTELVDHTDHFNDTRLGAGMFLPVTSTVDLYGQLEGVAETTNTSTTAWGEAVQGGVRVQLFSSLGVFGGVEYQHLDHPVQTLDKNEVFGVVGANYSLMKNLSLVGEFKASGQTKEAFGGVRLDF